jgi:hypothetical protein
MAEVTLVCLRPKDGAIQMQLRTCRAFSNCPACGAARGLISTNRNYTRGYNLTKCQPEPLQLCAYTSTIHKRRYQRRGGF